VFGNVTFDNIEPSASMTVTSILLIALTALGVVASVRAVRAPRRAPADDDDASGPSAAVFRIALLTAAVTTASTIAIAVMFERYQGDFVPFLAVGAAVGLFWLPRLLAGRPVMTRLVAIGMVVLGAWSVYATSSLALVYQREYSAFQSPSVRASFVDFQLDTNESLGLPLPNVARGEELPVLPGRGARRTDAPHGQLFVLGDCEALFIASGRSWEPIEKPPRGQERWRLRFDPAEKGTRIPVWSAGTGPYQLLWARYLDDRHVRFEYEWTGAPYAVAPGEGVLEVEPGAEYDLDVRLDPEVPYLEIAHDGKVLLSGFPESFDTVDGARLGVQPDAARGATQFGGSIHARSTTPICDRLVDHGG
jgi:hypothetical protein